MPGLRQVAAAALHCRRRCCLFRLKGRGRYGPTSRVTRTISGSRRPAPMRMHPRRPKETARRGEGMGDASGVTVRVRTDNGFKDSNGRTPRVVRTPRVRTEPAPTKDTASPRMAPPTRGAQKAPAESAERSGVTTAPGRVRREGRAPAPLARQIAVRRPVQEACAQGEAPGREPGVARRTPGPRPGLGWSTTRRLGLARAGAQALASRRLTTLFVPHLLGCFRVLRTPLCGQVKESLNPGKVSPWRVGPIADSDHGGVIFSRCACREGRMRSF